MRICVDRRRPRRRDAGFALLLALLALLGASAALLAAGTATSPDRAEQMSRRAADLKTARRALLAYAAMGGVHVDPDTGRPGTVPCPDTSEPDGEWFGTMNMGVCGAGKPVFVGRLPWRTLDLAPGEEPPWLVIDGNLANHGFKEPINPDVPDPAGVLEIDGEDGYAAILIAPGDPLDVATGRPSSRAGDYLERVNAVTNEQHTDCAGGPYAETSEDACNDRLLGITADETLDMARRRLLADLERQLRAYYHDDPGGRRLPYAAPAGSEPEQTCRKGLEKGLLPLSAEAASGGKSTACGEGQALDVCAMDPWLRPLSMEAFACTEGGNDWLRFVSYEIDPGCRKPGGPCRVRLAADKGKITRSLELAAE